MRFQYDSGYCAFHAFNLHNFLLQDVPKIFQARSQTIETISYSPATSHISSRFLSFERLAITLSFSDGSTNMFTDARNLLKLIPTLLFSDVDSQSIVPLIVSYLHTPIIKE
jgi:hypothetical protein